MKNLIAFSILFVAVALVETGETVVVSTAKPTDLVQVVETEENSAKVFSGLVKATRELMRPLAPAVSENTEL